MELINPYTNLENIDQIQIKALMYFSIHCKYIAVQIFRYEYESPYFLQHLEPENC